MARTLSKTTTPELSVAWGVTVEDNKIRVVVLHPYLKTGRNVGRSIDARLEEALGLAAAIDLEVVAAEAIALGQINAATYFGKGTVERLHDLVVAEHVDVVSVDASLSPVQQRGLENAWEAKVIDRTGLILEIFGERAVTREGVLQVELAHLDYQRSRLVRTWTHLERQRGGFGFLGGPGETQIEADRRIISERITKIRRELETVIRTRELHRNARRRVPYPVVALVGYTNAGKSTLFNRLTNADVLVKDLLFATLDPTMRKIKLPSGQSVILSDTVGFVSDLPTNLIAAFRATLEEVISADIIVHVRDIADPDTEAQKTDVLHILAELGVEFDNNRVSIEVLNKIDRLPVEEVDVAMNVAFRDNNVVAMSAVTGRNTDALLERLDQLLSAGRGIVELRVPHENGAAVSWLYRNSDVLSRDDCDEHAEMKVSISADKLASFEKNYKSR
ncbi:MAG: GTPase HflX [Pseudomonadota bacterium]|nr:GTPase HflX [Pseudomonadota bacterium]